MKLRKCWNKKMKMKSRLKRQMRKQVRSGAVWMYLPKSILKKYAGE